MSTEQNKAQAHRVFEAMNRKHLPSLDELIADNFIWNDPLSPSRGREAYKQFISAYFTAFPDLYFTIEDQIAEGDKVVTRYTGQGTQTGPFQNIPTTGKRVTGSGIVITRYADGMAVEAWHIYDNLGMMQQLGVVPAMGG